MRAGLIPDPTWWRENRNEGWTGGLTVNYGIGQGAMGVTPLQLAVMAARLGNNGYAVRPRLVREAPGVSDPPRPPHMSGIEADHLARVRDGMFGVCNEPGGTANSAGDLELVRDPDTGAAVPLTPETRGWEPVQIAGKTGTAQVRALGANRGRHYSTIEWRIATTRSSAASAPGTSRAMRALSLSNTAAPALPSPARSRAKSCARR